MAVQQTEAVEKATLGVSDITFVSELQPQSNCTEQKKKAKRRKAPIYWGKKPSRRKTNARRKLTSDLDLLKDKVVQNGEHEEWDTEEDAVEETTEKAHESDKSEGIDTNCIAESEAKTTDDKDEGHDIKIVGDGEDASQNSAGVLDLNDPSELCNELNSKNETEHISQLPKETQKNHALCEKLVSQSNRVEEKECVMETVGEDYNKLIFVDSC